MGVDDLLGPILPIMKVKSDEEAIRLMNDSKYGLTASIWTKDEKTAEEIADQWVMLVRFVTVYLVGALTHCKTIPS